MWGGCITLRDLGWEVGSTPYDAPKVRFSARLGEEPEVEVALF
jgi:hypothetical protein